MPTAFHWLISTDGGLLTRIAVGVLIFAGLGVQDWRRNRSAATRWKEYAFLLLCVIAAMVYGIINDQITCSFSWEFFYYGKGLEAALGPMTPPPAGLLHWEAAKVGMKATWSAGLILGVALLIANNPWRGLPRLRYRRLLRWLPVLLAFTAVFAMVGGIAGYIGWLDRVSTDFVEMKQQDLFRPSRFIAAWGVNLGAYVGGLLGTVFAVSRVIAERKMLRSGVGSGSPCRRGVTE